MDNKPYLRVPAGWRKREPLLIERYRNGDELVWALTQRPLFDFSKPSPQPNDVHEIRFHDTDEFISFIHFRDFSFFLSICTFL